MITLFEKLTKGGGKEIRQGSQWVARTMRTPQLSAARQCWISAVERQSSTCKIRVKDFATSAKMSKRDCTNYELPHEDFPFTGFLFVLRAILRNCVLATKAHPLSMSLQFFLCKHTTRSHQASRSPRSSRLVGAIVHAAHHGALAANHRNKVSGLGPPHSVPR